MIRRLAASTAVLLLLSGCTAAVDPDEPEIPSPFAACDMLTEPLPGPSAAVSGSPAGDEQQAAAGSASTASASTASTPAASTPAASGQSAPADGASAMSGQAAPAGGASAVSGQAAPADSAMAETGQPVPVRKSEIPDLSLKCFTGGADVRLRDLTTPAVINIWGSWCGPCREELPIFQGLADRADGRFSVIGVDTKDTRARGADFATDKSVSFPTFFDPEMTFANRLGATMLPATVFIDADGGMYVHRAAMDVDQLIEQVRKHFGVTVTR